MSDPFDSRFAQKLHNVLREDADQAFRELGSGAQIIRDDAAATGMNCAKYMGHIAGLELALKRMREVHDEMMGKTKEKKD